MKDGICSPDRKLIICDPTSDPQDDKIGDLPKCVPEDVREGVPSLDFQFLFVEEDVNDLQRICPVLSLSLCFHKLGGSVGKILLTIGNTP